MLTVRNRGGAPISRSQPRGPLRRGSCPLAGRDVTGLAKHLPQRRRQGWPQKGTQIYPQEAVFKCRQRPSLPEERPRHWETERNGAADTAEK